MSASPSNDSLSNLVDLSRPVSIPHQLDQYDSPFEFSTSTNTSSTQSAVYSKQQQQQQSSQKLQSQQHLQLQNFFIPPLPGLEEKKRQDLLFQEAIQEYKSTLASLPNNEILSKFKVEFEKLYKSLVKSQSNATKHFDTCLVLHKEYYEISYNAKNLQDTYSNDEQTIKNLKGQIKKANEFLESARIREERAKEQYRLIKQEINDLKSTIFQGVGLSTSQEKTLNDLMYAKEEATKELEAELDKISQLRNNISDILEKMRLADADKRRLEADIQLLREKNAARKLDIDSEMRNKERLELELKDSRSIVSAKMAEVKQKQDGVNRAAEDISMLESQLKGQRQLLEKLSKDQKSLDARAAKYREECDEQIMQTRGIMDENTLKLEELKRREQELKKIRGEVKKVMKIKESLSEKITQIEVRKIQVESDRKKIKAECVHLQEDYAQIHSEIETDKKILEDFEREKGIILSYSKKLLTDSSDTEHLLAIQKQTKRNLEQEIQRIQKLLANQENHLRTLKEERDKCVNRSIQLQESIVSDINEIQSKEKAIIEYKRQVLELETKLKHQQNLYEGIQQDRNVYSKHLVDTQNEISETKRQLKLTNFKINGYKEELMSKQESLTREQSESDKLDKEIKSINSEIENMKNQINLSANYIRNQVADKEKLSTHLNEAEAEKDRQQNALALVVAERDKLSAQLKKQNDELSTIYNKIKAHQFNLLRSEKHYIERSKTLESIMEDIRNLKREKSKLDSKVSDIDSMKKSISQLKAKILHDQTKIQALETELSNPVNVHRWRKLSGSNPRLLELIQLSQTLQRKIVEKTKEDKEKETLIREKEMVYLQLRNVLSKQMTFSNPSSTAGGTQVYEQVVEFERILKEKLTSARYLNDEFKMYTSKVKELKYNISKLDRSIEEVKKKYFEVRRSTGGLNVKFDKSSNGGHNSSVSMIKAQENLENTEEKIVDEDLAGSQLAITDFSKLPPLPSSKTNSNPQLFETNHKDVAVSGPEIQFKSPSISDFSIVQVGLNSTEVNGTASAKSESVSLKNQSQTTQKEK